MKEITIRVGLNDAVTKQQVHPTKVYVDVMKTVCRSYHVAFTFVISEGGYFHENGDYTQEKTLVISLLDPRMVLWMPSQGTSAPFSIRNPS